MIEDIRKIDWNKYSHAYGPATDLPDLIERLYTDSEETDAWDDFEYSVFHQGKFYSASPVVIPFMIDLIFYSAYMEQCLDLLWDIVWCTNWDKPFDLISLSLFRKDKRFQESQKIHDKYRKLTQEAILQGKKSYIELLDEPYDELYPKLLALLTLCGDEGGSVLKRIESHFKQSYNEIERATCLYSFGLFDFDQHQSEIENAIKSGSKIEQYISLLLFIKEFKSEAPLEYYAKILRFRSEFETERFQKMYHSVPFTLGIDSELGRCFSYLALEERTPLIGTLLQEKNVFMYNWNIPWLISLAFGEIRVLPTADSLNEIQKKVLFAISRRLWPEGSYINAQLRLFHNGLVDKYNFPTNVEEMEDYLGEKFI